MRTGDPLRRETSLLNNARSPSACSSRSGSRKVTNGPRSRELFKKNFFISNVLGSPRRSQIKRPARKSLERDSTFSTHAPQKARHAARSRIARRVQATGTRSGKRGRIQRPSRFGAGTRHEAPRSRKGVPRKKRAPKLLLVPLPRARRDTGRV